MTSQNLILIKIETKCKKHTMSFSDIGPIDLTLRLTSTVSGAPAKRKYLESVLRGNHNKHLGAFLRLAW